MTSRSTHDTDTTTEMSDDITRDLLSGRADALGEEDFDDAGRAVHPLEHGFALGVIHCLFSPMPIQVRSSHKRPS